MAKNSWVPMNSYVFVLFWIHIWINWFLWIIYISWINHILSNSVVHEFMKLNGLKWWSMKSYVSYIQQLSSVNYFCNSDSLHDVLVLGCSASVLQSRLAPLLCCPPQATSLVRWPVWYDSKQSVVLRWCPLMG